MFKELYGLRSSLIGLVEDFDNVLSNIPIDPEDHIEGFKWKEFIKAVRNHKFKHDFFREVVLAQAIVESGRGTSKLAKHFGNFLGLKFRVSLNDFGYQHYYETSSEPSGGANFFGFRTYESCLKCWEAFLYRKEDNYIPYPLVRSENKEVMKDAVSFIKYIAPIYCTNSAYKDKLLNLYLPEARNLLGLPSNHKKYKILLDPGHSEKRVGARGQSSDIQEEDLNRLQALIIKSYFAESNVECTIYDPLNDDLWDIGQHANSYDMFISLHHNAFDGDNEDEYSCVMVHKKYAKDKSKDFARLCASSLAKALNSKLYNKDGVYEASLSVLNSAERVCTGACVLTESYFIDAYSDKEKTKKLSSKAAYAICSAIEQWFGVKIEL